ncbi:MAG: hypothetical protein H6834_05520 [Planctomycetes bacterium]|nr:hypothetical protein [Planctomycetota bacterium]MCB9890857.1 hypothetical protein [Planctomycetota bacterium]
MRTLGSTVGAMTLLAIGLLHWISTASRAHGELESATQASARSPELSIHAADAVERQVPHEDRQREERPSSFGHAALSLQQLLAMSTYEITALLGHHLDGGLLDAKRMLLLPESLDSVLSHPLYNPNGTVPDASQRRMLEEFLRTLDERLAPHDQRRMQAEVQFAKDLIRERGIEEPATPSELTLEEQREGLTAFDEDREPNTFLESIAYTLSAQGAGVVRMTLGSDPARDRVLEDMTQAIADAELELIQLIALM